MSSSVSYLGGPIVKASVAPPISPQNPILSVGDKAVAGDNVIVKKSGESVLSRLRRALTQRNEGDESPVVFAGPTTEQCENFAKLQTTWSNPIVSAGPDSAASVAFRHSGTELRKHWRNPIVFAGLTSAEQMEMGRFRARVANTIVREGIRPDCLMAMTRRAEPYLPPVILGVREKDMKEGAYGPRGPSGPVGPSGPRGPRPSPVLGVRDSPVIHRVRNVATPVAGKNLDMVLNVSETGPHRYATSSPISESPSVVAAERVPVLAGDDVKQRIVSPVDGMLLQMGKLTACMGELLELSANLSKLEDRVAFVEGSDDDSIKSLQEQVALLQTKSQEELSQIAEDVNRLDSQLADARRSIVAHGGQLVAVQNETAAQSTRVANALISFEASVTEKTEAALSKLAESLDETRGQIEELRSSAASHVIQVALREEVQRRFGEAEKRLEFLTKVNAGASAATHQTHGELVKLAERITRIERTAKPKPVPAQSEPLSSDHRLRLFTTAILGAVAIAVASICAFALSSKADRDARTKQEMLHILGDPEKAAEFERTWRRGQRLDNLEEN